MSSTLFAQDPPPVGLPQWPEPARRGHFGNSRLLINEMPFARTKALREGVYLTAVPAQPNACGEIGGRAT
jgi:hypothetical protein